MDFFWVPNTFGQGCIYVTLRLCKVRSNIVRLVMKLELSFKNGKNALYKSWTSALGKGKLSL